MSLERIVEWGYSHIAPVRWLGGVFTWLGERLPPSVIWAAIGLEVGAFILWLSR